MPPKRDPRRDQAAEIYKQQNGNIDLADIAKQLEVSAGTVRGWKSKDKWAIGTERGSERSEKRSKRSKPQTPSAPRPTSVDVLIIQAAEENEELTDKERFFCILYVKSFNATQSYFQAYDCTYSTANVEGPALLVKPRIRQEIQRLKKIKSEAILAGMEDVMELHSRIAFADMNSFAEYENIEVPLLIDGVLVPKTDPETGEPLLDPATGEPICLTRNINQVRFKNSEITDGQLISEISQGRDGMKIKLRSSDASLKFLERCLSEGNGNNGGGVAEWIETILEANEDTAPNDQEDD